MKILLQLLSLFPKCLQLIWSLPQKKLRPLTQDKMAQGCEHIWQSHAEKLAGDQRQATQDSPQDGGALNQVPREMNQKVGDEPDVASVNPQPVPQEESSQETLIAFAHVYSDITERGQIFCLWTKQPCWVFTMSSTRLLSSVRGYASCPSHGMLYYGEPESSDGKGVGRSRELAPRKCAWNWRPLVLSSKIFNFVQPAILLSSYSTELWSHPYCENCCWTKTPKWNTSACERNEAVKPSWFLCPDFN